MAIEQANYSVFIGTGNDKVEVSVYNPSNKVEALFGIAMCHAFVLGLFIYAGSSCGGDCHFNPAVTMVFVLMRKLNLVRGLTYVCAQAGGSLVGALLTITFSMSHGSAPLKLLKQDPNSPTKLLEPDVSMGQGFVIEIMNTFFLVLTILVFTQRKEIPKSAFGGAIGLV